MVLDALDPEDCHARVEAWRRADSYTYAPQEAETSSQTHISRVFRKVPPARGMGIVGRTR
jgi:hypothetical protein